MVARIRHPAGRRKTRQDTAFRPPLSIPGMPKPGALAIVKNGLNEDKKSCFDRLFRHLPVLNLPVSSKLFSRELNRRELGE